MPSNLAKDSFLTTAIFLFHILQKYIALRGLSGASVDPASQIRTSSILLLLIVRKKI
jgi:hypothetical protein